MARLDWPRLVRCGGSPRIKRFDGTDDPRHAFPISFARRLCTRVSAHGEPGESQECTASRTKWVSQRSLKQAATEWLHARTRSGALDVVHNRRECPFNS